MTKVLNDGEAVSKEIERLRKRIDNLNGSISLQANKIGNTNILMVIDREEKILQDRIRRKKKALEDLDALKRQMSMLRRLQSEKE